MVFLDQVTPVVITWNEKPNVQRVFDQLTWARDVVVVDSGSDDGTLTLLAGYPNVRVLPHPFRSHADQVNFALKKAGITTEWVLSIDADYVLSKALVTELRDLDPGPRTNGYAVQFVYWALGRPLRGSLYPPRVVLFRTAHGEYEQEGHAHRLRLQGRVDTLAGPIFHDDRKEMSRWLINQDRYASVEAHRLLLTAPTGQFDWADRLRRMGTVAPVLAAAYCLIVKGCILDGKAGIHYTLQRVIAEALLAMRIAEIKKNAESG